MGTVKVVVTVCKKLFRIGGGFSRHILYFCLRIEGKFDVPKGRYTRRLVPRKGSKAGHEVSKDK